MLIRCRQNENLICGCNIVEANRLNFDVQLCARLNSVRDMYRWIPLLLNLSPPHKTLSDCSNLYAKNSHVFLQIFLMSNMASNIPRPFKPTPIPIPSQYLHVLPHQPPPAPPPTTLVVSLTFLLLLQLFILQFILALENTRLTYSLTFATTDP